MQAYAEDGSCIPLLWMSPLACPLPFGGLPFNTASTGAADDAADSLPDHAGALRISFPDGLTELELEGTGATRVLIDGPPGRTVALLYDRELGEVWFAGMQLELTEYCEMCCLVVLPEDGHAECEFLAPFIMFPEPEEVFYLQAVSCTASLTSAYEKSEVIRLILLF